MGICKIIQRDKSERRQSYNGTYTLPPSEKTLKKLTKILKEQRLKYSISYGEKEIIVKWGRGFFA